MEEAKKVREEICRRWADLLDEETVKKINEEVRDAIERLNDPDVHGEIVLPRIKKYQGKIDGFKI